MEETMLIARFESACSALLVACAGILASSSIVFAQALPWMNPALPPGERAALLVTAMTLDQKIAQIHGQPGPIPEVPSCGNGGRHVPGIPELQIPTFRITNGPVGIGAGDCSPQMQATALPSSLALAASWDPAVAYAYGDLIGREAVNVGVHVVEGPGMNMLRVPQGGRNFEYLGEDPFLAGALAVQEIQALQNHNIIAMAKHFVANEQEINRGTVNEIIDARTLNEIYLLPFEMSVKDGDVAAVMCAYPRVNGTYNCENNLLRDTLRGLWVIRAMCNPTSAPRTARPHRFSPAWIMKCRPACSLRPPTSRPRLPPERSPRPTSIRCSCADTRRCFASHSSTDPSHSRRSTRRATDRSRARSPIRVRCCSGMPTACCLSMLRRCIRLP